jgi:hypothetical protein
MTVAATLGCVWADPNHPDASKAVFPEGTVAFKLFFTMATKDQVSYLDGTPEWIRRYEPIQWRQPIRNNKVQLLQVNIAVKGQSLPEKPVGYSAHPNSTKASPRCLRLHTGNLGPQT